MLSPRLHSVQRLSASFAGILGLFAVALFIVLRALTQMAAADEELVRLHQAKDASQRVALLIREQYIHQAHTLIEGNESHLGHYRDVAQKAQAAASELRALASTPEEAELAASIEALVQQSHTSFMEGTLGAMRRDDHVAVRESHAAMDRVITDAARKTKALTASFTRRSDRALVRATVLRSRTRTTTLVCFGLAAILAAAVAFFTTRGLGMRLSSLREGVARIGSGDLEARVAATGKDEFAELATHINEMAAALTRREAELVSAQRLAAIGQVAAGVAHELNNPLGVVLGYVKTMRRDGGGGDEEGLRVIEEEASECQRIVQALLDLARPQPLAFTAVNLHAVVHDTIARLRAAGVLRCAVVERYDGDAVCAQGDETKVRQVVRNLLTNAAEATADDGEVRVDVEAVDDTATVTIADTGTGISEEERPHIYEPFFTTKPRGTGLGLTIVNAIVTAHRGALRLEAPPNGGTRIVVTLPLAQPAAEAR